MFPVPLLSQHTFYLIAKHKLGIIVKFYEWRLSLVINFEQST